MFETKVEQGKGLGCFLKGAHLVSAVEALDGFHIGEHSTFHCFRKQGKATLWYTCENLKWKKVSDKVVQVLTQGLVAVGPVQSWWQNSMF